MTTLLYVNTLLMIRSNINFVKFFKHHFKAVLYIMMCAYHQKITTVTAAELLLVFLEETDPAKTGAAGLLPPALED